MFRKRTQIVARPPNEKIRSSNRVSHRLNFSHIIHRSAIVNRNSQWTAPRQYGNSVWQIIIVRDRSRGLINAALQICRLRYQVRILIGERLQDPFNCDALRSILRWSSALRY